MPLDFPSAWNLYTTSPDCINQALEHAVTMLTEKGLPVRFRIGPTGKKTKGDDGVTDYDQQHIEAEAQWNGAWWPVITRNGHAVLDLKGDGLIQGTVEMIEGPNALTEVCRRYLPMREPKRKKVE